MPEMDDHSPLPDDVASQELVAKLKAVLESLPHPIPVYLFTQKGKNDVFNGAAKQVIQSFQELTDKIHLKEYDLKHKLATKWKIDSSPTLLFDPKHYNIRWKGAPAGQETQTFLQAIILIGSRKSNLSEHSIKIMKRIDTPRHIKLFVSISCPYCPQQAVNAIKAAIESPELITLEIIDILANPEIAVKYSAQSVPQTYVNDALIIQGAQPEELFILSLEKLEKQTIFIPEIDAEEVAADLVIVGGGPAGLTAAVYAPRSGLKTALIERGVLGGQVAITPVVENYPGITMVGGKTLVEMMISHALRYVHIFQDEEVLDIRSGDQPGDPITILTSRRRFFARAVLLATGATHKHLGVPGESRLSGRGVSYCSTCDGPIFKGKKVVVVGGGNSAVTETLNLHHIGVDVTLIHRRDALRAQEHLAKNLFENKIPVLLNTEVAEIRGEEKIEDVLLYNSQTKETTPYKVDGVFIAIGYNPVTDLAKKIGVEVTSDGYIKHDSHHRTNIPGIYSAGDVEGGYKQIVTAAGQGSEAALSIFEDLTQHYWRGSETGSGDKKELGS